MKIYQILCSGNLGGGELVAINLAASMCGKEIHSEVLIPVEGAASNECKQRGLASRIFNYNLDVQYTLLQRLAKLILFRLKYVNGDTTILHFHSPFVYGIFSRILRFSRVKSVVHVHLETDDDGLRWAFRFSPDVICVCAKFLEPIVRKNLPLTRINKQKIKVMSNAIDLNTYYPSDKYTIRQKLNIKHDVYFALLVADLAPHKGQETAIRSISQLKNNNINTCLWLVGKSRNPTDGYVLHLENIVKDLNLQNEVHFAGHRSDVPDLMRAADCLLLPSTREGLPLSILEAQASGLPVIAAPTSGIPEIVFDGLTGFLVDASDWEGYADKMKLLRENPVLCNNICNKALLNCKLHSGWDNYVKELLNVYDELI